MKKLSLESFLDIKDFGFGVPKDNNGFHVPFVVGKEYIIGNKQNNETIKVRCTQNCPYNLITI